MMFFLSVSSSISDFIFFLSSGSADNFSLACFFEI
nr:MAG TPA: hypothetical protein [Caudoviricetes sp.]